MAPYILIVEDEPDIRELLNFTISRSGHTVIEAETAEDALTVLDRGTPELIIIDWMLPGMDGIDLAKKLRADELTQELPIIMLTARGEESDKLRSFEVGIDDYVTKPFSPKELMARIKALLRRTGTPDDQSLSVAGIRLDLASHRLFINDEKVTIGPTEFKLLELFMRNPNRAFDRAQLLDRVWGRSVYVEERTVDVHVLRLRKILKPSGRDHIIETVRGLGYRLAA
jgi:two-component system phosphate regulon response regulator PhoB|tara:strand:- start:84 stop:764 length:681 start_codon:yes stop_codon:yes gene_type:complete